MRNFLDLADLSRDQVVDLLALAQSLQNRPEPTALAGKILGLLFLNPSLRSLYLDGIRNAAVDLDDPTVLDIRYIRLFADVVDALPAVPLRTLQRRMRLWRAQFGAEREKTPSGCRAVQW